MVQRGEATSLSITKINLYAGIRAAAGRRQIPHLLQRPALNVDCQRKGRIDDAHHHDKPRQQYPPLPCPPQEAHEEETYRHLAEGAADEIPRLPNHVELQRPGRVRRAALEDAEDGPYQCYYCRRAARVVVGPEAAIKPPPDVEADKGGGQGKARRSQGEGEKDRPSREVGCGISHCVVKGGFRTWRFNKNKASPYRVAEEKER